MSLKLQDITLWQTYGNNCGSFQGKAIEQLGLKLNILSNNDIEI